MPAADHRHRRPRVSPRGGVVAGLRQSEVLVNVGLWVFLFGAVIAPCLHQLNHRPDHVHDGASQEGMSTALEDTPPHHHACAAAEDGAAPIPDGLRVSVTDGAAGPPPVRAVGPRLPARHGHGSLSHFGLAVPAVAVFLLPPPCARAAALEATAAPTARPASRPHGLPEARGPPAA